MEIEGDSRTLIQIIMIRAQLPWRLTSVTTIPHIYQGSRVQFDLYGFKIPGDLTFNVFLFSTKREKEKGNSNPYYK